MSLRERVVDLMRRGQASLIEAFEAIDGLQKFRKHTWERPGGGGGTAQVLERGRVFEKAGVNVSAVHGDQVPPTLAAQHPGTEGRPYFATGVSLVLHPVNPYVPAIHANFRYFEVGHGEDTGIWWFGGGADMTPAYPFAEDVAHFHAALRDLCDRHEPADYDQMKATCDDYFTIVHRNEMRGVSGIFFDELTPAGQGEFETDFSFVSDGIDTLAPSYLPVVERRCDMPYGEREREWQLIRRGRYAEFNLVYDRGTKFGLQTSGNIEAILMSMPPYASWNFDFKPATATPEDAALAWFQPQDYLAAHASADEPGRPG